jgi:hypothetical protein
MLLWLSPGCMPIVREYALQSIFFIVHSVVIMGGSMFTATFLKVRGYPEADRVWHWLPVFVRNWGFTLILFPAGWVFATIWLERHRPDQFSKSETILTGILLLGGLGYFMMRVVLRAMAFPIIHAV